MADEPTRERTLMIHQAGSATEAMIIRGLLESAGIQSPAPTTTDPFPLNEPQEGTHGVEIIVLESQADEARRILQDYLDDSEIASAEGSAEEPDQ